MRNSTLFVVLVMTSNFLSSQNYHLKGGKYFIGGKFVGINNFYVNNGYFSNKKPQKIDSVIDLQNKYIISPFAEAHTHKLDNPKELKKDIATFTKEGVFYAMVLNNFSSNVQNNRKAILENRKIDVLYANGGITVTGQHPSFVYERIISGITDWWTPANTEKIKNSKKGLADAYWFMDDTKAVDKNWEAYMQSRPDFVKIYLLNIDQNDNQNPKTFDESTLMYIVNRAKKFKLRVVAHIESIEDLKVALKCGIKYFGHMPNYNINYSNTIPKNISFSEKEKRMIRKLKPIITPTLSFNEDFSILRSEKNNYQGEFDSVSYNRSLNFQKEMIKSLSDYGFSFVIGSDRDFFSQELFYWFSNRLFSNTEILELATRKTPQYIFPKRKIGEIKPKYEASFLVLNEDPIINFETLKNILFKVKNGKIIK